jgi:hypothetical protein
MKKLKIGIILLTLLIAAMAIVPIVSAVDASENSNQFGTVGGIPVGGSTAYGDHSIAVVGYVTSINNFVTIHDTWDDTNYHLLQDGSWDNIMTTWVRP